MPATPCHHSTDIVACTALSFSSEISFSFEEPVYSVTESDGRLSDTVQLVKDIETELNYTFTVSLRAGDVRATEG